MSLEGWTNSTEPYPFPDPGRDILSYMRDVIGETGLSTVDEAQELFFERRRNMHRGNWNPAYTAEAVINYIREGYGRDPIEPLDLVMIPDVKGRSQADASARLEADNVTIGEALGEYHDTVPAGEVIKTDPVAYVFVERTAPVDIIVSLGAEELADTTAPAPGTLTADAAETNGAIGLSYSGAEDETDGTGLATVELWVQAPGGSWEASGLTRTTSSGTFEYSGMGGDGAYNFDLRALDLAGNASPTPSGSGQASVLYDTAPPSTGSMDALPQYTGGTASISYSGVSDGGTGLASVKLWVQKDSGAWTDTGLANSASSGTFSYDFGEGDGPYNFALQTVDAVGNSTGTPAASQSSTFFDTTPPSLGTLATNSEAISSGNLGLTYSGVADAGSGVASVELWVSKDTGAWQPTGETSTGGSGSFTFTGFSGDGTYHFALRATDNIGNESPVPTGNSPIITIYDTTAPTLGDLTGPTIRNADDTTPAALDYTGAEDALSGLKSVVLWVRGPSSSWTNLGNPQSGASGSFNYDHFTGDGEYHFAIQAEDNAGNTSPAPSGTGQHTITVDGTAPAAPSVSVSAQSSASPVSVSYSGASDTGSGFEQVELWARKDTGTWAPTGMTSTASSGSFDYALTEGDGTYYFAIRAEDKAGNFSPEPSGDGQANTIFDTTPPEAATLTVDQYTTESPISIAYNANVPAEELQEVRLWAKKSTASWTEAGMTSTNPSGTFDYTGMTGDAIYAFYVQTQDPAGNLSPEPSGSGGGTTTYDTTPPEAGTLTASTEADSSNPIELSYSGATDNGGSGLASVTLWAKKDAGAWEATSVTSASAADVLSYMGMTGDGNYRFALRAQDKAGNESPEPAGDGAAGTVYDTTPPTSGTVSASEFASSSPIAVDYSGVEDAGSGLEQVTLYVKKNQGSWAATSQQATAASGSFSYNISTGDGTYGFALRAQDKAGNESALPSSAGASTVYDTSAPDPGSLTAPEFTTSGPITLDYSGVSDAGSGLNQVTLFFRKGAGAWQQTSLTGTASSGSFSFNQFSGDDTYAFALQAEDNAGSVSPEPSGSGQTSTIFDTTAPSTGSIQAPEREDGPPISILYSGVDDPGSGLDSVTLWVRKDAGGWTDTGMTSGGASGSFSFSDMTSDGTFYFALQTSDKAGNTSAAPTGDGQANTVYDTTFTAGSASSPAYATEAPVAVEYFGASAGEGEPVTVHLWVKQGDKGTWNEAGQSLDTPEGEFSYEGFTEDGPYYFAVQAENSDGERTVEPSGHGDTKTVYDTTPPEAQLLSSPSYTNQLPITVEYSGVTDSGSGVKEVTLWVKKGYDGAWEQTDVALSSEEAGSFEYGDPDATVEDRYFFYLQVTDNAGLKSPDPTDEAVFGAGT